MLTCVLVFLQAAKFYITYYDMSCCVCVCVCVCMCVCVCVNVLCCL